MFVISKQQSVLAKMEKLAECCLLKTGEMTHLLPLEFARQYILPSWMSQQSTAIATKSFLYPHTQIFTHMLSPLKYGS